MKASKLLNYEQYTQLRSDVFDYWNTEGKQWFEIVNNGFEEPDPTLYETIVLDWADDILSDPEKCVLEIGFNSVEEYLEDLKGRNA